MHCANLTSSFWNCAGLGFALALVAPAPVAVLDPLVVAAPALAALDAEVLTPPTVAAGGLPELPPHPATRTPVARAATASRRGRGGVNLFV
jgi:hypothetical protein